MKHNLIEIEQLYLSDKDANLEGEVKLWRAVINLALEDLSLPTSNERYRLWRKQAVDWFISLPVKNQFSNSKLGGNFL